MPDEVLFNSLMATKLKKNWQIKARSLLKLLKIIFVLIVTIAGLDLLLGLFLNAFGFQWSDPALSSPANYNGVIEEVWFAETYALILLPCVLFIINRKVTRTVFVSICLAVIMLLSVGQTFYDDIKQNNAFRNTNDFSVPIDYKYEIHRGSSFYPKYWDNIDPLLASVWTYLLRAQAPVLLITLVAYLASRKAIRADKTQKL